VAGGIEHVVNRGPSARRTANPLDANAGGEEGLTSVNHPRPGFLPRLGRLTDQHGKGQFRADFPDTARGAREPRFDLQDLSGQAVRLLAEPRSGRLTLEGRGSLMGGGVQGGPHRGEEDRVPARPEKEPGLDVGPAPTGVRHSNGDVNGDDLRI
jgi:hypothetical protein